MTFVPLRVAPPWRGRSGTRLRVVVLDTPYDTIDHPLTRALLPRIFSLKLAGYRRAYGENVQPIDESDVVAQHLTLCEERGDELEPLMTIKCVTTARCERHRIRFPARGWADPVDRPDLHRALDGLLADAATAGEVVGYSGGWTISPHLRGHPQVLELCRQFAVAQFCLFYPSNRIQRIVAGATLRFHVEAWKAYLGFEPLEDRGRALPPVAISRYDGELVLPMVLTAFRSEAYAFAEHYRPLWAERTVVAAG